jgi:hypothetical protein
VQHSEKQIKWEQNRRFFIVNMLKKT